MSRRRYRFLRKGSVYTALNKLRAAFLAAKDGNEVEQIIMGVLTHDERMKIGRRIEIAQLLKRGLTYDEISGQLKVGLNTVVNVYKKMSRYPKSFDLILKREKKVEIEYKRKAHIKEGSSMLIRKRKVYTGFKRKDVKR